MEQEETQSIRRSEDIERVLNERDEMVRVAHQILLLLPKFEPYGDHTFQGSVEAGQKLVEFASHLANIGSFCDKNAKADIEYTIRLIQDESVSISMSPERYWLHAPILQSLLVRAVGIQVDFNQHPFRVIGLEVAGFGARIKALLKK
jgi:hypothetical protein